MNHQTTNEARSNTTVRSTTGTSPLEFVTSGTGVHVYSEDGSGQVYDRADVLAALEATQSPSAMRRPLTTSCSKRTVAS